MNFNIESNSEKYEPSPEELAEFGLMELLQINCPDKDRHNAIRLSGSDDGCLTCGYYSK